MTYLNEQEQDVANTSDLCEKEEQEEFREIQDELNTSAVGHRENVKENQCAFPWVESSDESEGTDIGHMIFVKEQTQTRHSATSHTLHVYKSQGAGNPRLSEHKKTDVRR